MSDDNTDDNEPVFGVELGITNPEDKIEWWDIEHLRTTETLVLQSSVHVHEGRTIVVFHGIRHGGERVTQSYLMDAAMTYMLGSNMLTSLPKNIKDLIAGTLREQQDMAGPVPPSTDVQAMQLKMLAAKIAELGRRDEGL